MITINVTGETAEEVLAQIRGLVLSSTDARATASAEANRVDDAAREAMQAARTSAVEAARTTEDMEAKPKAARKQKIFAEEGKSASEDTQLAGEKSEASTDGTDTSGETISTSSTAASDASPSELNFDTDVAPVVLRVVQSKGKPAVEAVLEQFGVARASQLESSRWQELIDKLEEVG